MNASQHYDRLFGEFGLSPKDAARWVFASGWNAALEELAAQLDTLEMDSRLRERLARTVVSLVHISDADSKGQMQ